MCVCLYAFESDFLEQRFEEENFYVRNLSENVFK